MVEKMIAELSDGFIQCKDLPPFLRDARLSVVGAGQLAVDRTGRICVVAWVHSKEGALAEVLAPVECPQGGFERLDRVACAADGGRLLALEGAGRDLVDGRGQRPLTGAVADRDGAFVSADSGILFLDEVAELPPEVQAKLLRVLEDGWATPEGSDRPRKVDVRVVAATNRDLPALIRKGGFRADLYHRLDTLLIRVPPLRDHLEDVDAIARQLLPTLLPEGRPLKLSAKDVKHLRGYDWPGNVRQLIKVLKRSVYLDISLGNAIDEERQLGPLVEQAEEEAAACPLWPLTADQVRPMDEAKREYAARALDLHGGNIAATARALGIAINTLRSYLADWEAHTGEKGRSSPAGPVRAYAPLRPYERMR